MVHFATATASKGCSEARISIGEIKEFSLCFLPKIGERTETAGSVVYRKGKNMVVETRICVDGQTAARCKVKFHKEERHEDTGNTL